MSSSVWIVRRIERSIFRNIAGAFTSEAAAQALCRESNTSDNNRRGIEFDVRVIQVQDSYKGTPAPSGGAG